MTGTIWTALFVNLAMVSVLVLVWELLSVWLERAAPRAVPAALGVVFGVGIIASMAIAPPIPPGIIVDLRSSLIATAVFFGGPVGGGISLVAAAAFRFYLGGIGVFAGVLGLAITAGLALLLRLTPRRSAGPLHATGVIAMATVMGAYSGFLGLPTDLRAELVPILLPPTVLVSFVTTIIISLLMFRLERIRRLDGENTAYRELVRGLPDCLSVKDLQGRFILANPATARLMRAESAEALLGRTDADFYEPELAARYAADERAMVAVGHETRIEQPVTFPDGTRRWLSTLKAPLRDARGRIVGVLTCNRDISDQKAISELKDEFISTVSHELRTPLTSIRGSLGLVSSGAMGDLPPKVADLIGIATTNCARLVQLINDILDLERLDTGRMVFDIERCRIRTLIEETVSTGASYLPEKGTRIVLVDDAPGAHVDVEPARFQQVMANLMSNAIKFSPAESTVTIRTSRPKSRAVRISVEDQGSGIPESFRNRIFGRFEQADASTTRTRGGTGLGLSIAKSIVEQLGGRIGFECGPSSGTRFDIDLPEPGSAPGDPGSGGNGRRVLICTGRRDLAARLPALLDEMGMASDAASHPAAAGDLMGARDYAAVILGPDMVRNGQVSLAAAAAHVPLIAIAEDRDAATLQRVDHVVAVLREPLQGDALRTAIQGSSEAPDGLLRRVLCVENDLSIVHLLGEMLAPSGLHLVAARSLAEAREQLRFLPVELVVLDIALPDGSGLALLDELPASMPVIVFSALDCNRAVADRVTAVMTKTRHGVADVAAAIEDLVLDTDDGREVVALRARG